ncbi:hypothetical protein G7054_g8987 [Neopestalotiopsis clavispora]|nr:hypothetical protein G7054_g8987 [Neopestalotiopsis clavispora]
MPSSWFIISTYWDLSSVQAALNVIVSVLSTAALWAWSRFWWQRVSVRIVQRHDGMPLPRLLLVSGAGESWDTVTVLGRQLFTKKGLPLLAQIFVVICISVTSALSGPIAKVVKGPGEFGNLLEESVLWNETAPWTYDPAEWDPTWTLQCNYTNGVVLQNVTASGTANMKDPMNAFPAFRETYDSVWSNQSEYRFSADSTGIADWPSNRARGMLFFILVQSDPEKHDRMKYNNENLAFSISVFQALNFAVQAQDTSGTGAGSNWYPHGPIEGASYSRAECFLTRKAYVTDESRIPWPWTNDTAAIVGGYVSNFQEPFESAIVQNRTLVLPTAEDLVRFYQVYMASMGTYYNVDGPSPGVITVIVNTVELSIAFLVVISLLFIITMWTAIRYGLFCRHHKVDIEELCIPDGKVDWIIHAAKTSDRGLTSERPQNGKKRHNDREYLRNATFGRVSAADSKLLPAGLHFARVKVTPRAVVTEVSSDTSSATQIDSSRPGSQGSIDQSTSATVPDDVPLSTQSNDAPSRDVGQGVTSSTKPSDDEHLSIVVDARNQSMTEISPDRQQDSVKTMQKTQSGPVVEPMMERRRST